MANRRGYDSHTTFVCALGVAAIVSLVGMSGIVVLPWWLSLVALVAWIVAALTLLASDL